MSNLSAIIKDEISLEGLDGITLEGNMLMHRLPMECNRFPLIPGLWQRIKIRTPKGFVESSKVCNLCWTHIKAQPCFEFYKLPAPRKNLTLDKNSLNPENPLYKVNIIDEGGVLGSCEDYKTRIAVKAATLAILDYESTMDQFGNSLVIVADQQSRWNVLVPEHLYIPRSYLTADDFAILERVGRSRYSGERSAGHNSLLDLVPDPRSMFHRRERLRSVSLVCVQKRHVSNHELLTVFLPRFVAEDVGDRSLVIKQLIEEAQKNPEGRLTHQRAKELLGTFETEEWKKFRKSGPMSKAFMTERIPRYCPKKKTTVHDLILRLVPTKNPSVAEVEAGDAKEEKDVFLNTDGQYYGVNTDKQVLITVEALGRAGGTQTEISQILGLSRPVIRNALKKLLRTDCLVIEKRQVKSALTIFYIAKRLRDEKIVTGVQEEKKLAQKAKKRTVVLEEPLDLTLVDIYGVKTTINVKPLEKCATSVQMDTEQRVERLRILRDLITKVGISSSKVDLTRRFSEAVGREICRKPMQRLVQHLMDQGVVATYAATFVRESVTKVIQIICDRAQVNSRSELFLSTLKSLHKKMVPLVNVKLDRLPKKRLSFFMRHKEHKFLNFEVLRPFHKYLLHIAYFWTTANLTEEEQRPLEDVPSDWLREMHEGEGLPPAYQSKLNWKTFIAPRSVVGGGTTTGWITIAEISSMMPLYMIADIYPPILNAPNVPELLKHPIKKFYPISQCRTAALVDNKWSIETLMKNLNKLCFIGLLRFGREQAKALNKSLPAIYVNRRTTLKDTVIQDSPSIHFEFTTSAVVDQYWKEFARICFDTNLSRKSILKYAGTCRELSAVLKPIAIKDALELDSGSLPGDQEGAAGMHSTMVVHNFQYWDFSYTKPIKKSNVTAPVGPISVGSVTAVQGRRRKMKKTRTYPKVYDDVDVFARGATGLRTKWTPAEDTALLIARLANHHLCVQRANIALVSCIAYRDVLHWMCQSLDKSAKMCNRRVQFLCKEDVTKTTMEMCLKELKYMPAVTERFGPGTLQRLREAFLGEEEYLSAVKITFVELVHVLSGIYSKFTSTTIQRRAESILCGTKEEFLARFNVQVGNGDGGEEEEEREDLEALPRILVHTVYNVVHSSMCCSLDNLSYNYMLLDIYKNYPERVLSLAMERALSCGLITKFKSNQVHAKKTIPLNAHPFHLSGTYARKFHIDINYDTLWQIVPWIEEARQGRAEFSEVTRTFAFVMLGLMGRNAIEMSTSSSNSVRIGELGGKKEEEEKEEKVVMKQQQQQPKKKMKVEKKVTFREDVKIFDFDYEPSEMVLKLNHLNWHIFCYLKQAELTKEAATENGESLEIDQDGRCNFSCCIDDLKGLEDLEELLARVKVRNHKVGIKRTWNDLKAEKEKMTKANQKDLGSIAHLKRVNVKYVALLDDLSLDNFNPLADRVTEIKLKEGVVFPRPPDKELINARLLKWSLIGDAPKKVEFRERIDEKHSKEILVFIQGFANEGVSAMGLYARFGKYKNLQRILFTLLDNHLILFCGIEEVKLVHRDFMEPWTVSSYDVALEKQTQSQNQQGSPSRMHLRKRTADDFTESGAPKKPRAIYYDSERTKEASWKSGNAKAISLRMFPWTRVTGSINQRVVDRIFGSILLHIQSVPGVQLTELMKKFAYFHGAHLKLVLLVMEELGLIKVFKCVPAKVSLVSSYVSPEVGE